jgi:exosortase family protein XrtF
MSSSTRSILRFLGKTTAIYGLWYVLYDLWLLPDGRLDRWVSVSVTQAGGAFLSTLGYDAVVECRLLQLSGASGIRVVNGCNGLSTIGLFAGFVLAFPGTLRRRLFFLPLGMAIIYAANVARISMLASLQVYWPNAFNWIHTLGAQAFFHLIVFGLWVLWTHYGGASLSSEPSPTREPAISEA